MTTSITPIAPAAGAGWAHDRDARRAAAWAEVTRRRAEARRERIATASAPWRHPAARDVLDLRGGGR